MFNIAFLGAVVYGAGHGACEDVRYQKSMWSKAAMEITNICLLHMSQYNLQWWYIEKLIIVKLHRPMQSHAIDTRLIVWNKREILSTKILQSKQWGGEVKYKIEKDWNQKSMSKSAMDILIYIFFQKRSYQLILWCQWCHQYENKKIWHDCQWGNTHF